MPIPAPKSNEAEFSIETIALDRIDGLPLTIGMLIEIEKTKAETSTSFMNSLIATVGRKSDGVELTDDDVAKLSEADRNEFAKKVLGFNQYLFRKRVPENRRDDEERVVSSSRDGDVKHQKEEDESDSEYLFRLFKIQKAVFDEQTRRILAPFEDMLKANKTLFSPSFLEAFTRSQSATAQLGNMIDRMRIKRPDVYGNAATMAELDHVETHDIFRPELRVSDLSAIRNPIHDTNERLSDVVDRLDSMEGLALQMAGTVKSVSDAASQFLVAFGAATEQADRSSRRAIGIAVAAIVVVVISTLVLIGHAEWRAQRDNVNAATTINAISSQIESNREMQRENMARIEAELNKGNGAVMKSFDRLSSAFENLTESLRMQNRSPISSGSGGGSVPSK